jgi:hypothetical protein
MSFNLNRGVYTDRSGTITTGGTSQAAAAVNHDRRALFIHNPSAETENLFVNFGDAASTTAAGSITIEPGGALMLNAPADFVPTQAINVVAATTGHKFTVKEG